MESPDISITKLKNELKENYKIIDSLLKERNALKQAYLMQIDLVKALEGNIDSLQREVQNWKDQYRKIWKEKRLLSFKTEKLV